MFIDRVRLSRAMSKVLRHEPWLLELELDESGWVDAEMLLLGLQTWQRAWENLTLDDLRQVVETSDKKRYEMQDGKIRALYGHSIPMKIHREPSQPPAILYHGTSSQFIDVIMQEGLKPMNRQYVHFSTEKDMAMQVGQRKGGGTILLRVQAAQAFAEGIPFYQGNDLVWLADTLPAKYLVKV